MMKDVIYLNLLEAIQNKIPQKNQLVAALSKILSIEKEAIYRRLRLEVPFTFSELAHICITLGISLDSIANETEFLNRPFHMRPINLICPEESDYNALESFTKSLSLAERDPNSKFGSITNMIPFYLNGTYEEIYKFYLYKCMCQFSKEEKKKSFSEINISKKLTEINKKFIDKIRSISESLFIFDKHFIYNLVKDIKYFASVGALQKTDLKNLKEALLLFLTDLERYAYQGKFDIGSSVQIFLSEVHFDTCYTFIDSVDYKITLVRSFSSNDSYSFDEKIFENMQKWTRFLKRTSTLISESGEIERIIFFEKQREAINTIPL